MGVWALKSSLGRFSLRSVHSRLGPNIYVSIGRRVVRLATFHPSSHCEDETPLRLHITSSAAIRRSGKVDEHVMQTIPLKQRHFRAFSPSAALIVILLTANLTFVSSSTTTQRVDHANLYFASFHGRTYWPCHAGVTRELIGSRELLTAAGELAGVRFLASMNMDVLSLKVEAAEGLIAERALVRLG